MRTIGILTVVAGVVAMLWAATPAIAQQGHDMSKMKPGSTMKSPVKKSQASMKGQKVTVTVNNGKYSPSTINVKAGKPVHLTFKLGPKPMCGDTVLIKDYGINKKLVKGKGTMVMFTPKKSGRIAFTCGMGMYKGTIVVK